MNLLYGLANVLLLSGLIYLIWRQPNPAFLKMFYWPALILKLWAGLLVGWLYQHYLSGGDTFVYQKQADILSAYALQEPKSYLHFILTGEYPSEYLYGIMKYRGYSNSFFMVLLLHFLNFITHNHYYINCLYFSLFSFWGCWQLTKAITSIFPVTQMAAVLAFLFFPSVVFWSSGVLKESILVGSSALLLAGVLQFIYLPGSKWGALLKIAVAAYFCFKIRFYFAVAYFPLLASFALLQLISRKKHFAESKKLFLYAGAILVLGIVASFLHEAITPAYFFKEMIKSYDISRATTSREAFIDLPDLQPTYQSLIYYAPKAISSAIFRPFLGEINTPEYGLAGLENLLIFVIAVLALFTFRQNKPAIPLTLVLSLLIYSLVVAALIGFSTANLGSVSRYKIAFMPFLLYIWLQTGVNQKIMLPIENWLIRQFKA
ncbi:hypothetical protein [Adhaeribacter pallidiroseus]|uniref:Glycosyltransferase RgtA/B/C/D-like domain-containing protein n=1 Tax=Adhaeribacter pallidiroseus TaxID=2072847 RepID=A0A369QMH9_9BACT|nr:hypothetical protein [Adhaeribacter pallidiroseus]RDC64457.1 hypothetical protein AHMF7616_03071 [Adhaeribacter pallidiroseus]